MKNLTFLLTKKYFEDRSRSTISQSTWYKHLKTLEIFEIEPTFENIDLVVELKKISSNLFLCLDACKKFEEHSNGRESISRQELNDFVVSHFGDISPDTFRRWLRKSGISANESKVVPVKKLKVFFILAYIYKQKRINHGTN